MSDMPQLSDWYSIPRKEVVKMGGGGMFSEYASLFEVLHDTYPEYDWKLERFIEEGRAPPGYWNRTPLHAELLTKIGKELGIKEVTSIARLRTTRKL